MRIFGACLEWLAVFFVVLIMFALGGVACGPSASASEGGSANAITVYYIFDGSHFPFISGVAKLPNKTRNPHDLVYQISNTKLLKDNHNNPITIFKITDLPAADVSMAGSNLASMPIQATDVTNLRLACSRLTILVKELDNSYLTCRLTGTGQIEEAIKAFLPAAKEILVDASALNQSKPIKFKIWYLQEDVCNRFCPTIINSESSLIPLPGTQSNLSGNGALPGSGSLAAPTSASTANNTLPTQPRVNKAAIPPVSSGTISLVYVSTASPVPDINAQPLQAPDGWLPIIPEQRNSFQRLVGKNSLPLILSCSQSKRPSGQPGPVTCKENLDFSQNESQPYIPELLTISQDQSDIFKYQSAPTQDSSPASVGWLVSIAAAFSILFLFAMAIILLSLRLGKFVRVRGFANGQQMGGLSAESAMPGSSEPGRRKAKATRGPDLINLLAPYRNHDAAPDQLQPPAQSSQNEGKYNVERQAALLEQQQLEDYRTQLLKDREALDIAFAELKKERQAFEYEKARLETERRALDAARADIEKAQAAMKEDRLKLDAAIQILAERQNPDQEHQEEEDRQIRLEEDNQARLRQEDASRTSNFSAPDMPAALMEHYNNALRRPGAPEMFRELYKPNALSRSLGAGTVGIAPIFEDSPTFESAHFWIVETQDKGRYFLFLNPSYYRGIERLKGDGGAGARDICSGIFAIDRNEAGFIVNPAVVRWDGQKFIVEDQGLLQLG